MAWALSEIGSASSTTAIPAAPNAESYFFCQVLRTYDGPTGSYSGQEVGFEDIFRKRVRRKGNC